MTAASNSCWDTYPRSRWVFEPPTSEALARSVAAAEGVGRRPSSERSLVPGRVTASYIDPTGEGVEPAHRTGCVGLSA